MTKSTSELMDTSEELYDQYGKYLEQEHRGEYAIFPDGRTLVGADLMAVSDHALDRFGEGALSLR